MRRRRMSGSTTVHLGQGTAFCGLATQTFDGLIVGMARVGAHPEAMELDRVASEHDQTVLHNLKCQLIPVALLRPSFSAPQLRAPPPLPATALNQRRAGCP